MYQITAFDTFCLRSCQQKTATRNASLLGSEVCSVHESRESIYFHYTFRPTGKWWRHVKELVHKMVRHAGLSDFEGRCLQHYAHRADALRLQYLGITVSIYLDIDTLSLRSWAPYVRSAVLSLLSPRLLICWNCTRRQGDGLCLPWRVQRILYLYLCGSIVTDFSAHVEEMGCGMSTRSFYPQT